MQRSLPMKRCRLLLIVISCVTILCAQDNNEPCIDQEPLVSFSFKEVPFLIKKGRNTSSLVKLFPTGQFPYVFPEKAYLNGQIGCVNPLVNKEVALLSVLGEAPVIVTKDQPGALYWVMQGSSAENMSIVSIETINDADRKNEVPQQTAAIVGLSFGATATQLALRRDYFFLAVKGHESEFGQSGSGIALLRLDTEVETYKEENKQTGKEEEKTRIKRRFFNPLDAVTGDDYGNRAFPIDCSVENNPINIHDGLAEIVPNVVDMHWDESLHRLFVGLQVKTKHDARVDQGACAVLVGRIENGHLNFEPLVPHDLLKQMGDSIVAGTGPDKSISVHKIRTMKTTTGTMYLIVQGGNGTPDETVNKVCALPLVEKGLIALLDTWVFDKDVGTLAAPDVTMTTSFGATFAQSAGHIEQMCTPNQLQTMVGANHALPGTVSDIEVVRDAVWVAVKGQTEQQSGLFVSYAIFDEQGRIAAWTPWKRGMYSRGAPFKFCFNPIDRVMQVLSILDDGRVSYHTTSYFELKNGDEKKQEHHSEVAKQLATTFSQKEGGIQTIIFKDATDPFLAIDNDLSGLVLAGGYQKCAIVHSPSAKKHIFNDEALKSIGAITQIAKMQSDATVCFLAGGVYGVAILVDQEGNGVPRLEKFEDYVDLFATEKYQWKKISDHKLVRKIIGGYNCFYVATRDSIDRIDFNQAHHVNSYTTTQLMNTQQLQKATINDLIISTNTAIVGTTKGMFFASIDCAHSPQAEYIEWKMVNELGNQAIIKFSLLTHSGNEHQLEPAGQLYVLTGSLIEGRGFVYRLFVHNGEIKFVPFSKEQRWLVNCRGFRHNLMAEGSLVFSTKGLTSGQSPMIQIQQIVQPGYVPGVRQSMSTYIPLITGWSHVEHIILDTATGHLFMCGDGGIYLRE